MIQNKKIYLTSLAIILVSLFLFSNASPAWASGCSSNGAGFSFSKFLNPLFYFAEKTAKSFGYETALATAPDPDYCGTTPTSAMDNAYCSGSAAAVDISWPAAPSSFNVYSYGTLTLQCYVLTIDGVGRWGDGCLQIGQATSYTVSGLANNTPYSWSVDAYYCTTWNFCNFSSFLYWGMTDQPHGSFTTPDCTPPTVDLKANNSNGPITIAYNTAANLTWTSTNADSCTASGDWSGSKTTAGSESTGNLTGSKTYTLTCTGLGGSAADSVTVNVSAAPITGACGPAAKGYSATDTGFSGAFCNVGNPTPSSPSFPPLGGSTSWTCSGVNGGSASPTCTATKSACTARGFVSGNASPSSVNPGGAYTILCDYGANTNSINPVPGSGSCVWDTWVDTAAKFNCTAGATAGTFSNSCKLVNISPDYYCARTDAINNLTVNTLNNASCVGITALDSVTVGQSFSATVTMSNTGTKPWTNVSPHQLALESDRTKWTPREISLPSSPINPGQNATFNFNVTAPATTDAYAFNWRMIEQGVEWFGQTCSKTISVIPQNTCQRCSTVYKYTYAGPWPAGPDNICDTPDDDKSSVPYNCNCSCLSGSGTYDNCNDSPGGFCYAPNCGNGVIDSGEQCDNGAANNGACPKTCSASCTINSCKPHINLSPASFNFSGVSGSATPAGQNLNISNTGNTALNWTGSTNQGWCHLSSGSGSIVAGGGSQNITVTVDAPTNVGSFNCAITISGSNADNSPQDASVVYNVSAAPVTCHCSRCSVINDRQWVEFDSTDSTCATVVPSSNPVTQTLNCTCRAGNASWYNTYYPGVCH